MLIFRGLPPLLRLATLVGVLCLLSVVVLYGWEGATWLRSHFAAELDSHLLGITPSLLVLGMAFTIPASAYRSHERSPDTRGFPFHSWQEQARIMARLAALPLCALVLALVPMDPFALISLLVDLVAVSVNLWTLGWMSSRPADAPRG